LTLKFDLVVVTVHVLQNFIKLSAVVQALSCEQRKTNRQH